MNFKSSDPYDKYEVTNKKKMNLFEKKEAVKGDGIKKYKHVHDFNNVELIPDGSIIKCNSLSDTSIPFSNRSNPGVPLFQ